MIDLECRHSTTWMLLLDVETSRTGMLASLARLQGAPARVSRRYMLCSVHASCISCSWDSSSKKSHCSISYCMWEHLDQKFLSNRTNSHGNNVAHVANVGVACFVHEIKMLQLNYNINTSTEYNLSFSNIQLQHIIREKQRYVGATWRNANLNIPLLDNDLK